MLPPLADIRRSARVVALPMRIRFRGVDTREALLFEGPQGWAEFSPFPEYGDEEASTWLRAAISYAWEPLPNGIRNRIPVNATVPAVEADQVATVLARYPGSTTAKVKVAELGQTLSDDIARVRAVRDALGPEGRIRLDANGGWNIDEAEHAVHALAEFDLEYLEQPCTSVSELSQLRKRIRYLDIPIAADESIRKASDPLEVARVGAADLLVIKAQPLGGITQAMQIVARAGLPAVVSSALDTAIGLAQGAALAAALPSLDYACGLGTSALFKQDISDQMHPQDGWIPVRRVTPEANRLELFAAPEDRHAWWIDRLERCYALLDL